MLLLSTPVILQVSPTDRGDIISEVFPRRWIEYPYCQSVDYILMPNTINKQNRHEIFGAICVKI